MITYIIDKKAALLNDFCRCDELISRRIDTTMDGAATNGRSGELTLRRFDAAMN